jgi:hypothetical protein
LAFHKLSTIEPVGRSISVGQEPALDKRSARAVSFQSLAGRKEKAPTKKREKLSPFPLLVAAMNYDRDYSE